MLSKNNISKDEDNQHFYINTRRTLQLLNDSLTLKNIKSSTFEISVSIDGSKITYTGSQLRTGLYIKNGTGDVNDNSVIIKKKSNIYTLNKSTDLKGTTDIIFESRKIEIECNEYFSSEEYKKGDTIIFKNIKNLPSDLTAFLERKKGHTIVSLGRTNENTTLYNIIEILTDINIDLKTGEEIIINFGLGNTGIDTTGNLINRDNQHLITVDIETE